MPDRGPEEMKEARPICSVCGEVIGMEYHEHQPTPAEVEALKAESFRFRSALREIVESRKVGEQPSHEQLIARAALAARVRNDE